MAIDVGSFVKATITFNVAGASNPVINTFDWRCSFASATGSLAIIGGEMCNAIVDRYYEPVRTQMASQVVMDTISLRAYADDTDGYDSTPMLWAGTATTGMLPSFVTYSVRKIRSNYALRNGRIAYPGPHLGGINTNGTVSTGPVSAFANMFEGWMDAPLTVEADSGDYTFLDVIVREPSVPNTNPTLWSGINGFSMTKFGSQVSRK